MHVQTDFLWTGKRTRHGNYYICTCFPPSVDSQTRLLVATFYILKIVIVIVSLDCSISAVLNTNFDGTGCTYFKHSVSPILCMDVCWFIFSVLLSVMPSIKIMDSFYQSHSTTRFDDFVALFELPIIRNTHLRVMFLIGLHYDSKLLMQNTLYQ